MFKRHFSLLAIATLLLSPTVAQADLIDSDGNISVGNMRIQNTGSGTVIQTPKIQVTNPSSTDNRISVNRTTRRRSRIPAVRRPRTSAPMILNKKTSTDSSTTVIRTPTPVSIPAIPNIPTPTIRNSTIQNSTIRSSGGGTQYPTPTTRSTTIRSSSGDSETVNEQHQSIQCSGGGSSVSQSSTTINGRTVNSEVRSNCN
jgi:hypothetical protein